MQNLSWYNVICNACYFAQKAWSTLHAHTLVFGMMWYFHVIEQYKHRQKSRKSNNSMLLTIMWQNNVIFAWQAPSWEDVSYFKLCPVNVLRITHRLDASVCGATVYLSPNNMCICGCIDRLWWEKKMPIVFVAYDYWLSYYTRAVSFSLT